VCDRPCTALSRMGAMSVQILSVLFLNFSVPFMRFSAPFLRLSVPYLIFSVPYLGLCFPYPRSKTMVILFITFCYIEAFLNFSQGVNLFLTIHAVSSEYSSGH
jgi:hypothetical protein